MLTQFACPSVALRFERCSLRLRVERAESDRGVRRTPFGRIGWEPSNEHPEQVPVPLVVVVDRLVELHDRRLQLLIGEIEHVR
jgi:hypothetical protein